MRALLIDPATKSIREVATTGELEHAAELIGCKIVQEVPLDIRRPHAMLIDEEGAIKGGEKHCFIVPSLHQGPIFGPAIILGRNPTRSCQLAHGLLCEAVHWITEEEAHRIIAANQGAFIRAAEAAGFHVERLDDFTVLATA